MGREDTGGAKGHKLEDTDSPLQSQTGLRLVGKIFALCLADTGAAVMLLPDPHGGAGGGTSGA